MTAIVKRESNDLILAPELESKLVELNEAKKKIDEAEKELKEQIKAEMEKIGATQLKTDRVTISYKGEYDRESFDSKAFRRDDPETYNAYVNFTTVPASISVRVK